MVIGIDVGTGSARAGVFDGEGACLGTAAHAIQLFQESGGVAEQSSRDIWQAVCQAVHDAMAAADATPDRIAGLGFDATCSLVVVGLGGSVSQTGDSDHDIIVWMDHRATAEAAEINANAHDVLRYVGGTISPEMQTPKLLWLKRHLPGTYIQADHFMDLSDWLTWRATGQTTRSVCTVACKWTYLAHDTRWDADYFRQIGLGDLADDAFARIGTDIAPPGEALASGLTAQAAAELGLTAGTPVAVSLIDAHAGGVGSLGAAGVGRIESRMAYVFGTSACTMSSSAAPVFVDGVWGPYFNAMVPGLWLNEGGQSAAGATLDHLIQMHPARNAALEHANKAGLPLPTYLTQLAQQPPNWIAATQGITVVPDFNGNRAPFADPHARGLVAGLRLDTSVESLAALFVAGIAGIACGLRQILEAQAAQGLTTQAIVISGGAGENPLARQIIADTTGLPVLIPVSQNPVLLGSAMLGARAGGLFPRLTDAMSAMSAIQATVAPNDQMTDAATNRYRHYCALQSAARTGA
nr:FGGY-family carbohydrate kinase [Actibacterium sp. 188UL27-1]